MENNAMQRFKKILCVIGAEHRANVALKHAFTLAENNQANLTVVYVIEEKPNDMEEIALGKTTEELLSEMISAHQRRLERLTNAWSKNLNIQIKVLIGIAYLEVIHEVLRNEHDLVIKTAENSGLLERVFGSDDMHLLRKCPCPVWLVKSTSPKAYKKIMAAVDADDAYPPEELDTRHLLNIQILEMASSLAISEPAELHIVHVWQAIGESLMEGAFMRRPEEEINTYIEKVRQRQQLNLSKLIDESIEKLGSDTIRYLNPQTHLLKGYPRTTVSEFAIDMDVDLVVMGTVARTGLSGFFMGNTAESILNQLDCSVLAVKPPGFVTPVTLDE